MNNSLRCPKCGNQTQLSLDMRYCTICNSPFLDFNKTAPDLASMNHEVSWKNIGRGNILIALIASVKKCLLTPGAFYEDHLISHDSFLALLYALILGSISALFTFLWFYLFQLPLIDLLPSLQPYFGKNAFSTTSLIFTPFIIILKLFLCSCYFHFLLFCTRSNRQKFMTTFSIVCYSQSAAIFDCIPVIGNVISFVWFLYLLAIGFNKIHKISFQRSVIIIVLPPIILSAIFGMAAGLFIGAGILIFDMLKEYVQLIR